MGARQGVHRHPPRMQPGSAGTGCWPHGRDEACRVRLSPGMAAAGNVLRGGWDGAGKGPVGQAKGCAPGPSPQMGRRCPLGFLCTQHAPPQALAHIMGRVGAYCLRSHPIPQATMTSPPTTLRTPVMSCSTTAVTSHPGPQPPPAPLRHCMTSCGRGLITPQRHPRAVTKR